MIAVSISTLIGVAIGILITRYKRAATPVIGIAGILYTIPSLALFGMLIPFIGIGIKPALIALILYSQLALIRNTYVGIVHIDPSIREAGKGMGMSPWQFLRMVELPVALASDHGWYSNGSGDEYWHSHDCCLHRRREGWVG